MSVIITTQAALVRGNTTWAKGMVPAQLVPTPLQLRRRELAWLRRRAWPARWSSWTAAYSALDPPCRSEWIKQMVDMGMDMGGICDACVLLSMVASQASRENLAMSRLPSTQSIKMTYPRLQACMPCLSR